VTSQGQQLMALPVKFQECREYRHTWRDSNVIETGSKLEHVQKCPRCGNERVRVLSLSKRNYGHVIRSWQMRYTAKEYLLKRGEHDDGLRPTEDERGALRMHLLGRD
jgi:hypothetical protein